RLRLPGGDRPCGGGRGDDLRAGPPAAESGGRSLPPETGRQPGGRRVAATDGDGGGQAGVQTTEFDDRDDQRRIEDRAWVGSAAGAWFEEGSVRGVVVGVGVQRGPLRADPAERIGAKWTGGEAMILVD